MTVIFKDNQIQAVDKKLLEILECTLMDISAKISKLDLALNSLTNNTIQIDNKHFRVKQIETISIENFYIYQLQQTDSTIEENNILSSLDNTSFDIKNSNEHVEEKSSLQHIFSDDIKIISPDQQSNEISKSIPAEENINTSPIQHQEKNDETNKNKTFDKEINEPLIPEPAKEENLENKNEIKITEIKPEDEEISITFEDEFKEIENILSLDNKEAKELILKDLQKAAKDFDMDLDSIKELYYDLINQIKTSKDDFYNAIKEKDYEALHKISHSLKGASLNLRISNLAILLKTIDEKSKENISFDKLEFLVNNFYAFVNKIEDFDLNNTSNTQIPDYLKELILATIKDYVSTQNEKKLKKDLKYIEKLLNKKINSIEELQDIIKAEK